MKSGHQRLTHAGMDAAGHQGRGLAARHFHRKAGPAERTRRQARCRLCLNFVCQQAHRTWTLGRLKALAQPGHRGPAIANVVQHTAQADHGRGDDDQIRVGNQRRQAIRRVGPDQQ